MKKKKNDFTESLSIVLIVVVAAFILFNQYQLNGIYNEFGITSSVVNFKSSGNSNSKTSNEGSNDLSNVDLNEIKSTAQAITALFPLDTIKTPEDTIAVMISTGTPEYGEAMGVSFDDPVNALNAMASAYPALKQQAQQNPEIWQRYLNLAAAPRGISCEFCCGVGPQGIDSKGNLRCGCKHNPAAQTVVLWLMQNTDYNDAQILKEVMKWKSIFFPKKMVGLASQIAGGDTSVLKDLPGMVGGC